ncbi:uncharacterized protein LOC132261345 [Phlebotomus argentipes]|uniref:uncharacterized protein LOC132261345 n=1 Tax=Phlebotomus argentipes TaxID=94469 RepID=UPI0028932172|nr:uncharacterized protein LOC132261345 [Phlebotomus argentipes]
MYGMTQTTAIPSSSPSSGPSGLLPMVRKVRAPVTPIRGAPPPMARPQGSLHSFKGQKWSSFPESADTLRDAERRGDDREDVGGSVMRLDSREMSIYGVCPETDRFTAVVCHYCGIVVKPQALKSHIRRHAADPAIATALQAVAWTDHTEMEENQLKPPLAVNHVKGSTVSLLAEGLEVRDPGSLMSFKGQKWTTFLRSVDQTREAERKAEDRADGGGSVISLDGTELPVEVDRFTAVVCHFCGSVVKPQALQAHMNRHATDSAEVQVMWTEGKPWTEGDGAEEVSTGCLDSQLKPPMTATACMSSGLTILQHGTSPSKGTTAPSHPDSIETLDSLLHSDNLISNTVKASVVRRGGTGRGRGRQAGAKEREYDPDRHCGVPVESGKPCTRTLTCKSHALSLRRQVTGRTVPFDKLLLEHRNSRAARSRTSVSGVQPDADSSNSSSSFDIERKSLSGASNSNSSCGAALMESPLRHGEDVDEESPQMHIKLTDCSVTLNKLKREHTISNLGGKAKRKPPVPPIQEVVTEAPPETLLSISQAPEQQLTVTVPLSMISVMNLSASGQISQPSVDTSLFTLSNRARREVQRSKLHLLRRQGVKEEPEVTPDPTEEFPDIDTWHSAIPRPCQVNCMRLRRIGGGSILSRRFYNFRKALLANMSTSMATTPGQATNSGGASVGAVASLLSSRSGVGSAAKHTGYLDKVNFSGERIKV